MNLTSDQEKWLKKAVKSSGDKIEQSSVFLSLMSKSYKEDPLCALQLGIAVLLDKPIGILVEEGVEVPSGLAAFAKGIEPYKDISNVTEAAGKLIKKMDLVAGPIG